MLPSARRRKTILIVIISLLSLIIVILAIYGLTKIAHQNEPTKFISDPYPDNITYLGLTFDEENGYYVFKALDKEFNVLEDYSVRSFFAIKDMLVLDHKLIIYSDAVNEIAYDQKNNQFFLNEIDSFYNNQRMVKLNKDYMLILTQDNKLIKRAYNAVDEKDDVVISENILSENMAKSQNLIFVHNEEGIMGYDTDTLENKLIRSSFINKDMNIKDYNENYMYVDAGSDSFIYSFRNNKSYFLKEEKDEVNFLSFFIDGYVYTKNNNSKEINVNALYYDTYIPHVYTLDDNEEIIKMDYIDGNYCYLELEETVVKEPIASEEDEEVVEEEPEEEILTKYYVYDAVDNYPKYELTEKFMKIIRVK